MKIAMHLAIVAALAIAISAPAFATGTYNGGGFGIPDDGYNGSLGSMGSGSTSVPGGEPGGDFISDISLDMNLNHTWVGDLTIKLEGPGGLVTLMSRPGFAEPADDGSGCCGFGSDVFSTQTFSDAASASAEDFGGNDPVPPGSMWNPHGGVLGDTSLMDTFGGTNAVGNWTLYVGDGALQDTGDVSEWALNLTTVPEPTTLAMLAIGGLALARRRR